MRDDRVELTLVGQVLRVGGDHGLGQGDERLRGLWREIEDRREAEGSARSERKGLETSEDRSQIRDELVVDASSGNEREHDRDVRRDAG
jgi:hypothetical protein